MKTKHFIQLVLVCVLFLANNSKLCAQNENSLNESTKYRQDYFVTINLESQANILNPRWKIGFIKTIHSRLKFGVDIAYGNPNLSFWKAETKSTSNPIFTEHYRLWEFSPQLYYSINSNNGLPTYISATLFYINHKDIYYKSIYYLSREGTFGVYYKQANYTRKKYGLVFNYGVLIPISKNIGLNIYTGLGVRLKKNQFTKVIGETTGDFRRTDTMNILAYRDNKGLYFGSNFSFGIKLYFKNSKTTMF